MNIHQLSVHHDELQDRLLLRLNTQDQQEFRFWLTRRMTLRLQVSLVHGMVHLIQQACEKAEWGIVSIAANVTETNPGAPTESPRYTH